MNFLLDTNVCIALINSGTPRVQARLDKAIKDGSTAYLSSIVLFELWFGVWKSSRQPLNLNRLNAFISGPLKPLPFEATDSEAAGRIRADLRAIGLPIGDYDLLIAGQARSRGMTLITHNYREFARIQGLTIEDWEV